MDKLTKKERERIKEVYDAIKVRQRGEMVEVYTNRSRGDGGRTPWWMFAGYVAEVRRSI